MSLIWFTWMANLHSNCVFVVVITKFIYMTKPEPKARIYFAENVVDNGIK